MPQTRGISRWCAEIADVDTTKEDLGVRMEILVAATWHGMATGVWKSHVYKQMLEDVFG